jgi:hypothetical protein
MSWAGWGNWYGKPERNRASRMSCEQAKAHAENVTRWFLVGEDEQLHIVGSDRAICGAKLLGLAIRGSFSTCQECLAILAEIESVTA